MTFNYHIHQTSPDAEIEAVAYELKAKCEQRAAKYENPTKWVTMFYVSNGDLPSDKDVFYGWRNYARSGFAAPCDARVRTLRAVDAALIKASCSPSLENDTNFGRQLAENFIGFDFDYASTHRITLLGIFDGETLAGLASVSPEPELNIAWLRDILVLPAYRRRGLGKALVLSALSPYPNQKWHYQAAKHNADSISLAKSLAFTLEGAGLFI